MISVNITVTDGVAVCRLDGELDAFSASAAREAVAALGAFRTVVLDLGGVTFVDSAGLGVIVGAVRRIRERGGHVALCTGRPPIARVLTMAGLPRIVDVGVSVDDALERIATPAAS